MNVLFVTSWYPTPELTYGGIFVREHAKAARAAGHRVVVLHLAGPTTELDGKLWKMSEEVDPSLTEGIETHRVLHRRLGRRGGSYPLYVASAISAYRRLRDLGLRPDIIHAHVYGAGGPAALVAGKSRIPLVMTEHYSGVAHRSLSHVEARKARYAYNRSARILPVSRFLQEAIRSYGVDRPFEVVPNVVDTSVFFPPEKGRKPETRRRLLFVGNLEPSHLKGFPTLLRALIRLRERRNDWELDVIGGGPELARHEKSAAEVNLGGQVTFHGPQSKVAVAEAMRNADLFVLPSRIDNLPCVIAEALATGLPVISTTVGGIPELVDERSGKLLQPDDPTSLAEALDHTLGTLESFDSAAISASARDRFGIDVIGEQLSRIYDAVRA